MKIDVVIAIRVGGKDADAELVENTFSSITKNIGTPNYRICLSLDPGIPLAARAVAERYLSSPNFHLLHDRTLFWSEFINEAISYAKDVGARYFIKSHDDIQLLTPHFFSVLEESLADLRDPIGWISFDDVGYRFGLWSPPSRAGWYKDIRNEGTWDRKRAFQFHSWPENWWKGTYLQEKIHRFRQKLANRFRFFQPPATLLAPPDYNRIGELDFPLVPVRCHAPWNMFVAIRMDVLNQVGTCEHWQTYNALFVDEDWGLRAARAGYWNIWIPQIKYFHDRRKVWGGGNRSQGMISRDHERVEKVFKKKWGFGVHVSDEELRQIVETYAGTPVVWSVGRRSYEWDPVR